MWIKNQRIGLLRNSNYDIMMGKTENRQSLKRAGVPKREVPIFLLFFLEYSIVKREKRRRRRESPVL
jgi:hypothetical protein